MNLKNSEIKTAAILANGTFCYTKEFEEKLNSFSFLIAADGGLNYCNQMGIIPDLIIGDMDSVSEELISKYPEVLKKIYPKDKDKTDVEIAILAAIDLGALKVVLFGALEKRIDHSLYNLHLLARNPSLISIESEYETAFVIRQSQDISSFNGQTISLIPIGKPVLGVTTKGLKWELQDANLDTSFMSLSNVCLNDFFTVELRQGELLCCLCKKR